MHPEQTQRTDSNNSCDTDMTTMIQSKTVKLVAVLQLLRRCSQRAHCSHAHVPACLISSCGVAWATHSNDAQYPCPNMPYVLQQHQLNASTHHTQTHHLHGSTQRSHRRPSNPRGSAHSPKSRLNSACLKTFESCFTAHAYSCAPGATHFRSPAAGPTFLGCFSSYLLVQLNFTKLSTMQFSSRMCNVHILPPEDCLSVIPYFNSPPKL